jgi:tyrosine-specific transport protein
VAITAAISTLIGGYLALSRFCADALKKKTVAHSKSVISLTLLPSLFFAFKGPDVYFSALKFSGAVVVVILWGILPPLMAKALWTREGSFNKIKKSLVYVWTSIASVALGFGVRSVVYV